MTVAGLVLHTEAERLLETFLASPTHAALLSGHVGTGKTLVAEYVAGQLLGADTLESGNHPYYRVLAPEKEVITIEQVRELIRFFQLATPGKTRIKRVAVVQDADRLGADAQNALLKLLEEPPIGSVLLLTSSHPERLLPTIRSRVQQINLPNPSLAQLEAYFAPLGHSAAAVQKAALRHGSNIGELQAELTGQGTTDASLELVKQALSGSPYDRLLLVDGLAKQKQAAHDFADTLATVALASLDSAARKQGTGVSRWQGVLAAAHTAQEAMALNGNAKLVLTELMLSL